MADADLASAAADLDDDYLTVMLLTAVNRARDEEPRRAGFWNTIAVILAEEQEKRRSVAVLEKGGVAPSPEPRAELEAVLQELRAQVASLEVEARESVGNLKAAGD